MGVLYLLIGIVIGLITGVLVGFIAGSWGAIWGFQDKLKHSIPALDGAEQLFWIKRE